MKTETLYCVHVSGMDILVPMESIGFAVRAAAYMNAEYLELNKRLPDDGLSPHCFAAPAVWEGEAESHRNAIEETPNWYDRVCRAA